MHQNLKKHCKLILILRSPDSKNYLVSIKGHVPFRDQDVISRPFGEIHGRGHFLVAKHLDDKL